MWSAWFSMFYVPYIHTTWLPYDLMYTHCTCNNWKNLLVKQPTSEGISLISIPVKWLNTEGLCYINIVINYYTFRTSAEYYPLIQLFKIYDIGSFEYFLYAKFCLYKIIAYEVLFSPPFKCLIGKIYTCIFHLTFKHRCVKLQVRQILYIKPRIRILYYPYVNLLNIETPPQTEFLLKVYKDFSDNNYVILL